MNRVTGYEPGAGGGNIMLEYQDWFETCEKQTTTHKCKWIDVNKVTLDFICNISDFGAIKVPESFNKDDGGSVSIFKKINQNTWFAYCYYTNVAYVLPEELVEFVRNNNTRKSSNGFDDFFTTVKEVQEKTAGQSTMEQIETLNNMF